MKGQPDMKGSNFTPAEEAIVQGGGAELARLLVGLVDLTVFYRTHPSAPLPDGRVLSIRVPDSAHTREERVGAVTAIAEALGVVPQWRHGVLYAAREFGSLLLECHYTPDFDAAQALRVAAKAEAEVRLEKSGAAA